MNRSREIAAIEEYYFDVLKEPMLGWSDYDFRCRSYMRWAAEEIAERVRESPDLEPKDIVLHFMAQTERFSKIRLRNRDMFLAAYEAAMYIYDLLNALD